MFFHRADAELLLTRWSRFILHLFQTFSQITSLCGLKMWCSAAFTSPKILIPVIITPHNPDVKVEKKLTGSVTYDLLRAFTQSCCVGHLGHCRAQEPAWGFLFIPWSSKHHLDTRRPAAPGQEQRLAFSLSACFTCRCQEKAAEHPEGQVLLWHGHLQNNTALYWRWCTRRRSCCRILTAWRRNSKHNKLRISNAQLFYPNQKERHL